jgi:hypothetical protein
MMIAKNTKSNPWHGSSLRYFGRLYPILRFIVTAKVKKKLLVGPQGISLNDFLLTPPEELFP